MILPPGKRRPPYIHTFRDRHGTIRSYYRRGGRRIAIDGDLWSKEWWENYQRIHASHEKQTPKAPPEDDFAAAMRAYLASPHFRKLAPNTQKLYSLEANRLVEHIGPIKLRQFTRGMIVQIRDQIAERTPRRAVQAVLVIRKIFERACDLDMMEKNPAKGVIHPAGYKPEPHRPWTDAEIATFLAGARPAAKRAVIVLLHTGLRVSDAVLVRRSHIANGRLYINTGKTNADVVVPISDDLAAELATPLPIEHVEQRLLVGHTGQALIADSASKLVRLEARRLGLNPSPPIHGLRKNAVMHLIEAGCTEQEVGAFTGQSPQVVRHYAQAYNRDRLVDSVVLKLKLDNSKKK